MTKNQVFRVLACADLSSEAGRQKLGGIYRFLSQGYVWDLSLIRSQKNISEAFFDKVSGQPFDGYLIAFPETAENRLRLLQHGKPTVFIDYLDSELAHSFKNCVFIHDDDIDIGRCAARNLLAQGPFGTYAYAASSENRPWNTNRARQFRLALANRRITPAVLNDTENQPLDAIAAWLKSLPRPIGIFAAYDDTARRILDACQAAKLQVPADVAVLGLGNDELICLNTRPQLSSIVPGFEEEGFLAARELQALMLRKRPPVRQDFSCACRGIEARGSTKGERNASSLVQQAVDYIRQNALAGITAADVVRHLRVSRRLADLRFRERTGTSILAYITDIRLAEVQRLLATTELRIGEIARKCGYDAANLKNLFARRFNCSMRDWRKGRQPSPATSPTAARRCRTCA